MADVSDWQTGMKEPTGSWLGLPNRGLKAGYKNGY
jgi:hypothetical protein